jgi:hypothetical protein
MQVIGERARRRGQRFTDLGIPIAPTDIFLDETAKFQLPTQVTKALYLGEFDPIKLVAWKDRDVVGELEFNSIYAVPPRSRDFIKIRCAPALVMNVPEWHDVGQRITGWLLNHDFTLRNSQLQLQIHQLAHDLHDVDKDPGGIAEGVDVRLQARKDLGETDFDQDPRSTGVKRLRVRRKGVGKIDEPELDP